MHPEHSQLLAIIDRLSSALARTTAELGADETCYVVTETGRTCGLELRCPVHEAVFFTAARGPAVAVDPDRNLACGLWGPGINERCGLLHNHPGAHASWPSGIRWSDPTEDIRRDDQPVTYALPGAPPSDRKVTGKRQLWEPSEAAETFVRSADGWWHNTDPLADPTSYSWSYLLEFWGPLTLVPLTEEEESVAEIYGPPGARWGNPAEPCVYEGCVMGVGHIGPHMNDEGDALGTTESPERANGNGHPTDTGITPHEASQTPCTCGHPERHRRGCPRYGRISGGDVTGDGSELVERTEEIRRPTVMRVDDGDGPLLDDNGQELF